MPELSQIGVGTIVFVLGAALYLLNLLTTFTRRGRALPIDGVGLMVLGVGLALLLKW